MIDSRLFLPKKHLNYGYEFISLKIIGALLVGGNRQFYEEM